MNKIVVIGPFPPPVHGMAKNLEIFSKDLCKKSEVYRIDISPGVIKRSLFYHLNKIRKVVLGIVKFIYLVLVKRVSVIYMPPDAGFGVYYSLIFATLGRIFFLEMILHHRSFAYIDKSSFGMKMIISLYKNKMHQIFLCEKMRDDFNKHYPNTHANYILSNAGHAFVVNNLKAKNQNRVITIGLLSNLSAEKGVIECVETFKIIKKKGLAINLIFAGPFENNETKEYLLKQIAEYPKNIRYMGYIAPIAKEEFYNQIDVFLFPTKYKNEAQPNVLFEACGYGVPVIALNRGCIKSDIVGKIGLVIDDPNQYAEQAAKYLEQIIHSPALMTELSTAIVKDMKTKHDVAVQAYDDLLQKIANL